MTCCDLNLHVSSKSSDFGGVVDGQDMADPEDDDEEKKGDTAEALLHEFVYKLKNYFLEPDRVLKAHIA